MKIQIFFGKATFLLSIVSSWAMDEGMPSMPRIQPKKSYLIKTKEQGEELLEQRGYGDQEPKVRMMNLMMVGGSEYEGMDMSETPSQVHDEHGQKTVPHDQHGHEH